MSDPIRIPIVYADSITGRAGVLITPDLARQIVALGGVESLEHRIDTFVDGQTDLNVGYDKRIAALEANSGKHEVIIGSGLEPDAKPQPVADDADPRDCEPSVPTQNPSVSEGSYRVTIDAGGRTVRELAQNMGMIQPVADDALAEELDEDARARMIAAVHRAGERMAIAESKEIAALRAELAAEKESHAHILDNLEANLLRRLDEAQQERDTARAELAAVQEHLEDSRELVSRNADLLESARERCAVLEGLLRRWVDVQHAMNQPHYNGCGFAIVAEDTKDVLGKDGGK